MCEDSIALLKEAIDKAKNICVFTGAGISCPSGIPDFRSADGLYSEKYSQNYSPEQIVSHTFFTHKPDVFYDFYKSKIIYPNAEPNNAHKYFAQLEAQGKRVSIVTQNIDGLHQAAKSSDVIELHGSVHRNYCTKCSKFYNLDYIVKSDGIPCCEDDGEIIKPDVVLYEEQLDDNVVSRAISAVKSAGLMIIVGTSLTVYPAASFVRFFEGDTVAIINKSQTGYDSDADISINDDIINVIKQLEK